MRVLYGSNCPPWEDYTRVYLSHIHKCENGCELREYCVNECERAHPHRANSVAVCELVRIVWEFGVTMAQIVCEPRERAVNDVNPGGDNTARILRTVCDRANRVRMHSVRVCE